MQGTGRRNREIIIMVKPHGQLKVNRQSLALFTAYIATLELNRKYEGGNAAILSWGIFLENYRVPCCLVKIIRGSNSEEQIS